MIPELRLRVIYMLVNLREYLPRSRDPALPNGIQLQGWVHGVIGDVLSWMVGR